MRKSFVRLGYSVASGIRTMYWFVVRPTTRGVKTVIEHDGRWLMIRNSYGKGHWTFPGGKVEKNEAPDHAAMREVREEVAVALDSVTPVGMYTSDSQYKHDTVYCYLAHVDSPEHKIDEREVIESAWIRPEELPSFRSKSVDQIREMLSGSRT